MAEIPSVKGIVLAEPVERTRKLLEEGQLSRRELEARLRPEDLIPFEETVNDFKWYEVEFYVRVAALLRDLAGEGRDEYLHEIGFVVGKKLIDGGLYQQMEYLGRAQVTGAVDAQARFAAYGRDLKLFVTLSGSILNFSSWSVTQDPDHDDRYRIEVRDAAAFPDLLGWGSEGLIDAMATSQGLAGLWHYERLAPDFVVFRMGRAL